MERLLLKPCTIAAANEYIKLYHRHHGPVVGAKFPISLVDSRDGVRGVVVAGRPVSRMLDDGWTLEVTRLCTDGTFNACSMLYSAAWRAARAMGYLRMLTYILESESGTSLKAAGWVCRGPAGGGSWSCKSRPRQDKHPLERKVRWQVGDWAEALERAA